MAMTNELFDRMDNEVEDLGKYKPGGYHPVVLGEVLPKPSTSKSRKPRYWILQKLGHGAFATVWLAKDLLGSLGYVALKINISRITGENNEIQILQWLQNSDHEDRLGYRNVIHILDDFTIQGPNGTHECIVTEVVAPMKCFCDIPDFKPRVKELSLQLMMGLSYLHSQGVTHGDLHYGNIAVSIPRLKEHSVESIMDLFDDPELIPVVAQNPWNQTESVPAYVLQAGSLVRFLEEEAEKNATFEPLCLKIMDFGNSFRKTDKRPPSNTPIQIRAPEVTFYELSKGKVASDWNKPIDIWAAACTIYHLNYDQSLLYGYGKGDGIIHRTLVLAGPLPPAWRPYWNLDKYCEKSGEKGGLDTEGFWAKQRIHGCGGPSQQDTDQLINLLRSMLKVNPDDRPQASTLLSHAWFSQQKQNRT
ncbi:predicted protein [Uncinocarpus reesii 1704]|uniref:non-specific serine/threonine protein kinase n=1 Tax=Uncinocarpus reesii (strain UAMH 1704) TaxID=336963 RepID=C4JKH1_UNCRE|nr:uncharacterized protein UREG_02128 [Uncinocarpus reesii 1704]EEP77279.1 predicted protein [Uncinocarpus reesii 1704]